MSSKMLLLLCLFLHAFFSNIPATNCGLFSEYIGAEDAGVKFTDVPINPNVDVHLILAFAIDYTTGSNPTQTNGNFNVFWDSVNLTPESVSSLKQTHSNVKVGLSLGGYSIQDTDLVYFNPSSIDSWVSNAVSSLTQIIQQYNLDGIDIDYEHFSADGDTFSECIGRLITTLKNNGVISFSSIAPFDDDHYTTLWSNYADVIDYVNFQFYGYEAGTTVSQFLNYYEAASTNYDGAKLMASFATDNGTGGLKPSNGFFDACNQLKSEGKLNGIFVWSADNSKKNGNFQDEAQAQSLLAS